MLVHLLWRLSRGPGGSNKVADEAQHAVGVLPHAPTISVQCVVWNWLASPPMSVQSYHATRRILPSGLYVEYAVPALVSAENPVHLDSIALTSLADRATCVVGSRLAASLRRRNNGHYLLGRGVPQGISRLTHPQFGGRGGQEV